MIDRDTEIVFAVLHAMATSPRGKDVALDQRLGEEITASLLTMALAPAPIDPVEARRNIIVAVRKGVIAALNPRAAPLGGGRQSIAARTRPC
jgi:hypothetical protein